MGLGGYPESIVDVGAGAGEWRSYLGQIMPDAHWTAVEIWEPYIRRFNLETRYNQVHRADIREWPMQPADLYLFGDVLEHMPADDAVAVWDRARFVAHWLVISLPVLPYPQEAVNGNPYEAHVHQWDTASVLERFRGIISTAGPLEGSTVGAFIARGTERM